MVLLHKESRPFQLDRQSTAISQASGHGRAWQLICIDCGASELIARPTADDFRAWTCADCLRRRATEDRAFIDQQGIRRCHRCKKRLSRRNFGPQCYACDLEHSAAPGVERTIYNEDRIRIMAMRAEGWEIGDLADRFRISERMVREVCRGIIPDEIKDDILARYDDGALTYADVAREFSISQWTARTICGPAEGTDFRQRNQQIADDFEAGGVTYQDLAEKYGLAADRIYRIVSGHVAKRNMPRLGMCSVDDCEGNILARGLCGKHYMRLRKAGGEKPQSKVSQETREQIRSEYVPGLISHRRLAAKYGLAESTIWSILHKESE